MALKLIFLAICIFMLSCHSQPPTTSAWHQICAEDPHDIAKAIAKMENPLVAEAAKALTMLPEDAQYRIPEVLGSFYRSHKREPKVFLNIMCSEYRDNPELLTAKLGLLGKISIVKEDKAQGYDSTQSLWSQLNADGFRNLVLLQRSISDFRNDSKHTAVDLKNWVINECELKYIFKDYIATHRFILTAEEYQDFETSRRDFLNSAIATKSCTQDELDSSLSFRGVGYISPRDPESALMRQLGEGFSRKCAGSRSLSSLFADSPLDCDSYINSPYLTRRKVAEQTLRRLLKLVEEQPQALQNKNLLLFLLEDLNNDGQGEAIIEDEIKKPEAASLSELSAHMDQNFRKELPSSKNEQRNKPREDLIAALETIVAGASKYSAKYISDSDSVNATEQPDLFRFSDSAGTDKRRKFLNKISTLLDRHILFYKTFLYLKNFELIYPSTTPFLSTSADISQAFKFSVRGFANDMISDDRLAWMYVFKIKKSNMLISQAEFLNRDVDLTQSWINESGFTQNPYAKEERGLDRLFEPASNEYEGLLYLGEVKAPAELLMLLETKSMNEIQKYISNAGEAGE